MRSGGLLPVFILLLAGCAGQASSPARPLPSQGAFSEQILEPLAAHLAGEKIRQRQAEVDAEAAQSSGSAAMGAAVGSLLGPTGGIVGGALGGLAEGRAAAEAQRKKAWFASREGPLKREILQILESRLERTPDGFAVCTGGKKRVYAAAGAGFRRLDDLPADCPRTELQTLKEEPITVTK